MPAVQRLVTEFSIFYKNIFSYQSLKPAARRVNSKELKNKCSDYSTVKIKCVLQMNYYAKIKDE